MTSRVLFDTWAGLERVAVVGVLAYEGRFLSGALRRERVTEEEVLTAVRAQGIGALYAVAAVVLETDGSYSVVSPVPGTGRSTLGNLAGGGDGGENGA